MNCDYNLLCKHVGSNEGKRFRVSPNLPTRFRPTDVIELGSDKKVMNVESICSLWWSKLS